MAANVVLTVISAILAWSSLSHVTTVNAQTFDDYPVSSEWPGISTTCATALNTTVQCSGLLPLSAENNQPRLNAENLTSLCTASCLTSLNNAKQTIQASCTLATDVITLDTGTFPGMFAIPRSPQSKNTQQYCDVLLGQWLNQPSLTVAQNCSDCILGVSQMQLNSPFGYDDGFASDFISLTSSCSKTTYPFTSPAPYTATVSTTATLSPTASPALDPGCVTLYTIQAGDTCDSIAVSQNVSTWAVYGASGIRDCSNLPTGSKLCLQGECWLHQVKETDTCDSIIAAAHISVSPITFVAWNPNINPVCTNLHSLVGYHICLRSVMISCLADPNTACKPRLTVPLAARPDSETPISRLLTPQPPQLLQAGQQLFQQ
ncbi:hypothetical protein GE09DRAFT_982082 [Coniochaeta sp. 2T2.1]|nr:hypothetical protein GE09DRAFT_982082 [Coniochaeta sp. 2T2.1]